TRGWPRPASAASHESLERTLSRRGWRSLEVRAHLLERGALGIAVAVAGEPGDRRAECRIEVPVRLPAELLAGLRRVDPEHRHLGRPDRVDRIPLQALAPELADRVRHFSHRLLVV